MPKKERGFFEDMDDSPSSFPKHVIVPSANKNYHEKGTYSPEDNRRGAIELSPGKDHNASVLTPESVARGQQHGSYGLNTGYPPRHEGHYSDVFREAQYPPHYSTGYAVQNPSGEGTNVTDEPQTSTRRWACDYCNVATFESYDEACAHEEECARLHRDERYREVPSAAPHSRGPMAYGMHPMMHPYGPATVTSGMGALYHAGQEVVTPPTPHSYNSGRWPPRGPPIPVLPQDQHYYRQGYYDAREDPAYYGGPRSDPYFYTSYHMPTHPTQGATGYSSSQSEHQEGGIRMLLARKDDRESLSDRQCFVRSDMIEIFAATEQDVQARHSKGAQKLEVGQVGIRCLFCLHLRPRDRAERAVCYPSSISRIYQTVADMQRFHFESCEHIPHHVRETYRSLKTTRPRGMGSPQVYWKSSALGMGLIDTETGIRFKTASHPTALPVETTSAHTESAQSASNPPADMGVPAS